MVLKFKKRKVVKSITVSAKSGSFATEKTPIKFENCRERFATQWYKSTKGFFFKHRVGHGKDIASFVQKTEQIVGQRNFSSFAETNYDTILWVGPSYFWRSCRMRRQLFTLILRAGMDYDVRCDNYEEAMFRNTHLSQTKNAIRRFLYGFTRYIGDLPIGDTLESTGWVVLLRDRNKEFVKRILVKPRGKLHESDFDLRNSLWL